MCGIAGILNCNNAVNSNVLLSMAEVIKHRGPDDSGEFIDANIGLAHRRLSIIDIEDGKQPMQDSSGRYTIVFNGEIYNYLELRQELVQKGYHLRTYSDTEVLLYMLIESGIDCLGRLNGMFAFAFYDKQSGKTILARDHFGIKPLYYISTNEGIVFASEIKSILKHPSVLAETNDGAIYEYLTFQFCLDDRTLFKNIRKLEPAHYMIVESGKVKENKSYWNLNFHVDAHHTEEYFSEKLGFLLQDSIRLQLRSDVPIGAYLSGGLDSSSVTCYAAELLGAPISTFCGGFNDAPEYNETEYARAVSKHAGTLHHEIFPNGKDFVDSLPNLIYHMDEPAAGPGLFPQYFVSKLASENVKVILGGQGGDEIFGGYARYMVGYLEQCIKSAIFEEHEEGKFVVTLDTIIPNLSLLKQYAPLIKKFWSKGVFESMDRRYFQLINRTSDLKDMYSEEFLRGYNEEKTFETYQKMFNAPETSSYFNKMTYFDMRTLLPALLQVEDRMSMSVSLESRVPLLDYRIVELAASMPPTLKFANGQTKNVLKQVVKKRLPKKVFERKDKMGFPVPISLWLKKGIVRDFVMDTMQSKRAQERGMFSKGKVETMLNSVQPFGRQLWGALCLELWHKEFIDS